MKQTMQNTEHVPHARDERFDFLRCILMLGVCVLHSLNQYDCEHWRYGSMWYWCVDGFVFISGWFGISFRLSKIVRLYSVALWCAIVVRMVGGEQYGVMNTLQSYWFLHAYLFMMLMAPIIESAIEYVAPKGRRVCVTVFAPFVLLVFGWSYLANFCAFNMVPHTPGLGASTGLSLLGIYSIARILKKTDALLSLRMSGLLLICVAVSVFLLGVINCNLYNSPSTLLLTILTFVLVLRLPKMSGKVWKAIAPSMFPVYLLHTNGFVFGKIKDWVDGVVATGCPRCIAFAAVALGIFLSCVGIDVIRRSVVCISARIVDIVCAKIDSLYDRMITKISSASLLTADK